MRMERYHHGQIKTLENNYDLFKADTFVSPMRGAKISIVGK